MIFSKEIFCSGCKADVRAELVHGSELYPHRADLKDIPYWRCRQCRNFVGCHHKTADRTKPMGIIATDELKKARQHIHRLTDPLWKSGRFQRGYIYALISQKLGYAYHAAELRSIEEARVAYRAARDVVQQLEKDYEQQNNRKAE